MVGVARIELATPAMSTQCSTTELYAHTFQTVKKSNDPVYVITIGATSPTSALWQLLSQPHAVNFVQKGFHDQKFGQPQVRDRASETALTALWHWAGIAPPSD
jgi:hypothetical protein